MIFHMEKETETSSSMAKSTLDNIQKIMNTDYSMEHHQKKGPDFTRPRYRDGKRKTAVKAYSVANESQYLLIHSVPVLNLYKELKDKFKQFGRIELLISLPNYPNTAPYTEVYLLKYERIANARTDDQNFYGEVLHVCYAPEFESVSECRLKLHDRKVKVRCQIARNKKELEDKSIKNKVEDSDELVTGENSTEISSEPISNPEPSIPPTPYISPNIQFLPPPVLPPPQFRPYFQYGQRMGWDYAKVRSAEAPADHKLPSSLPPTMNMPVAPSSSAVDVIRVPSSDPKQTVPLPLQQALAWRPVTSLNVSLSDKSDTTQNSCQSSVNPSSLIKFDFQPPRLSSGAPSVKSSSCLSKLVPRQISLKNQRSTLSAQASILGPEHGPQVSQSFLMSRRKRAAEQGPMQSLDWEITVQKIRKVTGSK